MESRSRLLHLVALLLLLLVAVARWHVGTTLGGKLGSFVLDLEAVLQYSECPRVEVVAVEEVLAEVYAGLGWQDGVVDGSELVVASVLVQRASANSAMLWRLPEELLFQEL